MKTTSRLCRAAPGLAALAAAALACGPGSGAKQPGSSSAGSSSDPQSIAIAIEPAAVQLGGGASVQFRATVYGAAAVTVTWSVVEPGGGRVDPAGGYTAPAAPGTYHVVAKSEAAGVTATATVTVATAAAGSPTAVAPGAGDGRDLASLPLGALPGCMGSGCVTRGGYAPGTRAFVVTSLDEGSGPGTLGACIAARGPRVCLFRVSGTINGAHSVFEPHLTIDGYSAPGDGVQLSIQGVTLVEADCPLVIQTSDVVVRGVRIRPGLNESAGHGDASPGSCLRAKNFRSGQHVTRIVVDHVSCALGNGRNVDFWGQYHSNSTPPSEFTFSWNLLAEPLAAYGASQFWESRNWISGCASESECAAQGPQMTGYDFHHNLIHSGGYRNPDVRAWSGRFVNNVVSNAGSAAIEVVGASTFDVVNNVFQKGPFSAHARSVGRGSDASIRLEPDGNSGTGDWPIGQDASYYVAGNVDDAHPDPSADAWAPGLVAGAGRSFRRGGPLPASGAFAISAEATASVRSSVLAGAGAAWRVDCGGRLVQRRDRLDQRYVEEVARRGGIDHAPYDEGDPAVGGIPAVADVGGRTCAADSRDNASCACADRDGDGLPDYWESAFCGSATGCDALGTSVAPPWTNLEAYLSGLRPAP